MTLRDVNLLFCSTVCMICDDIDKMGVCLPTRHGAHGPPPIGGLSPDPFLDNCGSYKCPNLDLRLTKLQALWKHLGGRIVAP